MTHPKIMPIAQAALSDSRDFGRAIRAIVGVIQQHQKWRGSACFKQHFPVITEQELLLALRLLAEQLEKNTSAAMHAIVEAGQEEGGSNVQ